ncbi:TPA: polyamine aminopropyltransferase [Candidatus Poribacteria bacterium]|nr:polyamine aminopropyltransferase [Candidatus Poribacteria bacterium]
MELWAYEEHNNTRLEFKVKQTLFVGRSKYQRIAVLDTVSCGKLLLLDGMIMLTEKFEFVYHDMLVHPPLFVHPSPKRVLIIGGGDGGAIREVVKHEEVEQVELVEIDPMVIDVCKKYIPTTACQFDHPKLKIHIKDGFEFIKHTPEGTYDVILIDSTDPIPGGPAVGLYSSEFYTDLFNALKEDGIVTAQIASPYFDEIVLRDYYLMVSEIFPIAEIYLAFTPDYPTGMWAFSFASKRYHPIDEYDPDRYLNSGIETGYYNEEIHRAAFALPTFARKILGKEG